MQFILFKDLLKTVVAFIIFIVLALSLWNGVSKEGFEDAEMSADSDTTDSIPYTDSSTVPSVEPEKPLTEPSVAQEKPLTNTATPVNTKPLTNTETQAKPSANTATPVNTKPLTNTETQAKPSANTVAPVKPLTDTKPIEDIDDAELDITIETTTKLTDLFDKVNNQMDTIRTLKMPYSNQITEIKFLSDDEVSADTLIQINLLHLLRDGIKPNDEDIRSNPGLKKYYPYGGMGAIIEKLIQTLSIQCTTITDLNKCYRMSNQKNIIRIENIVNTHQTILDKIMEKQ